MSETNLECVVCDAFTGGSVLCAKCRAKGQERAEGKIVTRVINLIARLCAEAEQRGYEKGLAEGRVTSTPEGSNE